MRNLTAVAMKWAVAFAILAVWGLVRGGPSLGQAIVISLVVAGISWLGDRWLPFRLQGLNRWAIDGGLAAVTIYLAQFLWPGPGITLLSALIVGFGLGALELPLHTYLAARFGLRRREDDRDGIR